MTPDEYLAHRRRLEILKFWHTALWGAVMAFCVSTAVHALVEKYGPQPLWTPLAKQALHQVPPDAVQADAHGIEDVVGECLPR